MLKPELYEKTVNILVDAYFNDTLQHSNCYACAVGNIVAGSNNIIFGGTCMHGIKWFGSDNILDTPTFYLGTGYKVPEKVVSLVTNTGYSIPELAKIEVAFEMANQGNTPDDRMFNGLMAVIEVLDQIHQNTDTQLTTATKQKFIKVPIN